jgi:DNA polymerase-3 subunit epsilon
LGTVRPQPLPPRVTDEDRTAHREFVEKLGEAAIWRQYRPPGEPADSAA